MEFTPAIRGFRLAREPYRYLLFRYPKSPNPRTIHANVLRRRIENRLREDGHNAIRRAVAGHFIIQNDVQDKLSKMIIEMPVRNPPLLFEDPQPEVRQAEDPQPEVRHEEVSSGMGGMTILVGYAAFLLMMLFKTIAG
jgi:hypothetical protein